MAITVEVPEHNATIEFPDGTAPEVIQSAMAKQFGGAAAAPTQTPMLPSHTPTNAMPEPPLRQTLANYARPVLEGVGAAGGAILGAGGGGLAGLAGGPAAPGTVPYGAIAGGVAGAGLGYAAGSTLADIVAGKPAPKPGETAGKIMTGAEMEMGGQLTGALLNAGLTKLAKNKTISNIIEKGIEKGIRPSIEGNRTSAQQKQYMDKAKSAVKSIVQNKENLQLTDEFGEPVKALPKTLKQFGQAIDQTKGRIFDQYDAMATQAGEAGAKVDLRPISKELLGVSNDKVLNTMSPSTASYAAERAAVLNKVGTFSTKEAQDAVAIANQSLEAFYKNPSYDTASKAYVDSLVVNHLRKGLDTAIESLQGPGYQQLKNEYGALKAIEKDVNRRAIVDARRNNKGLIDFSDIFSGSEVVRGILTMNPATVGTGVTAKVIASLYKLKNDPNRIVKGMFDKVGKMLPQSVATESAPILPPPAAQMPYQYGGAVNTGNLPQGPQTLYDMSIGARIPTSQGSLRNPSNFAQGPQTYFDKTIGARTLRKQ